MYKQRGGEFLSAERENIRYLHMSNEPGMMGLKMRQDMATAAR